MYTSSVVILQHILIYDLRDSIFLLLIIHIREVSRDLYNKYSIFVRLI